MKIVTIWNTYGPYHLARVRAIDRAFADDSIICFSHCASNHQDYPFFRDMLENHEVISNRDSSELNFFSSFLATLKLLRKHQPSLILTCGYERPETLAAVIYAKIRTKFVKVFLMLDNQIDDHPRKWLYEFIKSLYLKLFDGFLIGGNTHLEYLKHLDVDDRKVAFGYNCVDNDSISALSNQRSKQSIEADDLPSSKYFLCVSRLVEKKNIPTLLQAYAIYKQSIDPLDDRQDFDRAQVWRLIICGDGNLRDRIIDQISALNLVEDVMLAGRIDDLGELVQYYNSAEVLILPSHHDEQWGLVVNEAMAAKLPVLVSQQCGCSQHLVEDGVNGWRFDGNSITELADRMIWMHKNQDRLADMGENSWQIVQRYSPANFARQLQDLYELVI